MKSKKLQKILERIKKRFSGVWYSPVSNQVILLQESIQEMGTKKYLEYADSEFYGKEISLKKFYDLKFEKICNL